MGRAIEILKDHLQEHPAVQAWASTRPERLEPESIAVIKPWKRNELFGTFKSGVYRLGGVGRGGSAVIAKRCPLHTAKVERLVYEEFLPRLALPSLSHHGSVEAPDGQSWWLFLEEAIGEMYSPLDPEHRALAARWLAAVHRAGCDPEWKTRLPDRGPEQHLQLLRSCRAKVREHFNNPCLPPDCTAVLRTVSDQCDALEARWTALEGICQVPRTLTHGDFVTKNLRVRPSPEGPELLVFDWEYAGWGVPAADLVQFTGHTASPDLGVYRSCLESRTITEDTQVQRLADCGRLFRLLDTMHWAALGMVQGLPLDFLLKPVSELASYSQRMARALSEMAWMTLDQSSSSGQAGKQPPPAGGKGPPSTHLPGGGADA